jgi:hypothetical protein
MTGIIEAWTHIGTVFHAPAVCFQLISAHADSKGKQHTNHAAPERPPGARFPFFEERICKQPFSSSCLPRMRNIWMSQKEIDRRQSVDDLGALCSWMWLDAAIAVSKPHLGQWDGYFPSPNQKQPQ